MQEDRERMVYEIKTRYGVNSPDILSVMLQIPRHKFVDLKYEKSAYLDKPLPIGYGATMSQPFTVAYMTDLLDLTGKEKVLEIGTGSGYQAAVLSRLCREVYSIEIIPALSKKAAKNLKNSEITNVRLKTGNGEEGWKEYAPFDAVLVTAGLTGEVPKALFEQLAADGVIVAPVGKEEEKTMKKYTKVVIAHRVQIKEEDFGTFRFVPFIRK